VRPVVIFALRYDVATTTKKLDVVGFDEDESSLPLADVGRPPIMGHWRSNRRRSALGMASHNDNANDMETRSNLDRAGKQV